MFVGEELVQQLETATEELFKTTRLMLTGSIWPSKEELEEQIQHIQFIQRYIRNQLEQADTDNYDNQVGG
jgi:hypothetical protein